MRSGLPQGGIQVEGQCLPTCWILERFCKGPGRTVLCNGVYCSLSPCFSACLPSKAVPAVLTMTPDPSVTVGMAGGFISAAQSCCHRLQGTEESPGDKKINSERISNIGVCFVGTTQHIPPKWMSGIWWFAVLTKRRQFRESFGRAVTRDQGQILPNPSIFI